MEAIGVIPLSKVNDRSRIGPKGTYYVDRNGGLVIDDGNGDTLVLSDAEYDKNKEN